MFELLVLAVLMFPKIAFVVVGRSFHRHVCFDRVGP